MEEGLCVQIMHIGPFDDEPATVAVMNAYLAENGYENDLSDRRLHHEIYMSDARKHCSCSVFLAVPVLSLNPR